MTFVNLRIASFRPKAEPDVPLPPKQQGQLKTLLEIIDRDDGLLRVAWIGPQMVGHAFVLHRVSEAAGVMIDGWNPERPGISRRLADDRCAYVTDVLVKEGYRRLGIGRALIADAAGIARVAGCARLVLHVKADNEPAHRLYERMSFVRAPAADGDESVEYALPL